MQKQRIMTNKEIALRLTEICCKKYSKCEESIVTNTYKRFYNLLKDNVEMEKSELVKNCDHKQETERILESLRGISKGYHDLINITDTPDTVKKELKREFLDLREKLQGIVYLIDHSLLRHQLGV